MANLSDVAALAGVSISAVSRVLSNAPSTRVSDATRERIRSAARELEYRPNFAGRALKNSRTDLIALVVPDLTNAVLTEMMYGVEDEASARGYTLLLARSDGARPIGEIVSRLIGEGRVDGALVEISSATTADDLADFRRARVPPVLINTVSPDYQGSVSLPNALGARMATEHLIGLGHQRIGLVGGPAELSTSIGRREGFHLAMAEAGLAVDPEHESALGYSSEAGRHAIRSILMTPNPPTAVVVANSNAAIGALRGAHELRVAVPEALSISSVQDAWTTASSWPALTTVRMPLHELGRRAMVSLVDIFDGAEPANVVIDEPSPELIVRESSAAPIR